MALKKKNTFWKVNLHTEGEKAFPSADSLPIGLQQPGVGQTKGRNPILYLGLPFGWQQSKDLYYILLFSLGTLAGCLIRSRAAGNGCLYGMLLLQAVA